MSAVVLAMVGTDHHPFERMVDWIDTAALRYPDVRFVVQHGATRAPRHAEGHAYFRHDELRDLVEQATVFVCHGGPGTIMDAKDAGHVPICVPRDPGLGEHVDGHQQRFARLVADVGIVKGVFTREDFTVELERALEGARAGVPRQRSAANPAIELARDLLGEELDVLMTQRVGWTRASRRRLLARAAS